MSFFTNKIARIVDAGVVAVFGWLLGKFLFGVGLGVLLAVYLPCDRWVWVGWAAIIASLLVSAPAAKAAWCKPKPTETP